MFLCDNNHVEICYEKGDCPLCKALKKLEDAEDKISDLQIDLEAINEEVYILRN